MVLEKQLAFSQAWVGIGLEMMRLQQALFLSAISGQPFSPDQALDALARRAIGPVHRKAVANAKRLGRARRR